MKALRVLVTRPVEQAHVLCAKIEAAGGVAIPFPVLTIEPKTASFNGAADIVIFISANAVKYGLPLLLSPPAPLPRGEGRIRFAAVGDKTAQALSDAGYPPDIVPASQFDSEGLLALPELHNVAGQRIAIFRGNGGREILADTLRERGADVQYVEVYQRVRPHVEVSDYPWIASGDIDAIIITSGESLMNLFALLNEPAWVRDTPFVVIGPRLAELASARGIQHVHCAAQANDEGLFAALEKLG